MTKPDTEPDLIVLTSGIVASYVMHNAVSATALPELIQQVHRQLSGIAGGHEQPAAEPEPLVPAVPIRKSYRADAIICLECGAVLKMLKRHLGADHGLTPQQYRAKWNLPDDYPLVAPSYSLRRSELAKVHGLGRPGGAKDAD